MLVLTLLDHGRRDVPDRAAADLRADRPVGARCCWSCCGCAQGIRRRRRMGRRRADGGRARAARPARVLRQLAADRRAGRPAAVDGGVRAVLRACPRTSSWRGAGACRSCSASLLVVVGLLIRLRILETPAFAQRQRRGARGAAADRRGAAHATEAGAAGDGRAARRERRVLHLQRVRAVYAHAAASSMTATDRAERRS